MRVAPQARDKAEEMVIYRLVLARLPLAARILSLMRSDVLPSCTRRHIRYGNRHD